MTFSAFPWKLSDRNRERFIPYQGLQYGKSFSSVSALAGLCCLGSLAKLRCNCSRRRWGRFTDLAISFSRFFFVSISYNLSFVSLAAKIKICHYFSYYLRKRPCKVAICQESLIHHFNSRRILSSAPTTEPPPEPLAWVTYNLSMIRTRIFLVRLRLSWVKFVDVT